MLCLKVSLNVLLLKFSTYAITKKINAFQYLICIVLILQEVLLEKYVELKNQSL